MKRVIRSPSSVEGVIADVKKAESSGSNLAAKIFLTL